jgi:hypothetical protein
VQKTIEDDLQNEMQFLRRFSQFKRQITFLIDMPDQTIDLLFRFLQQNRGLLSKRARERKFKALSETEIEEIEDIYRNLVCSPSLFQKTGLS